MKFILILFFIILSVLATQPITANGKTAMQIKSLERIASTGDANAQYLIGATYLTGRGEVKQDKEKGIYWITKSAKNGNSDAQFTLGLLYEKEEIKPGGMKKAVMWYKKAVEQGSTEAQEHLATLYDFGIGVPKDEIKAVQLLELAASKGSASAQSQLAMKYENGETVTKNINKAIELYKKAVENGDISAYHSLGSIYEIGTGVKQDLERAFLLYKKGAELGDPSAQIDLGVLYMDGRGVTQDYSEAYYWISLYLRTTGYEYEKFLIDQIRPHLSTKQLKNMENKLEAALKALKSGNSE